MKKRIVKRNSFAKKNILRFCFIIVFASTFWSCTKDKIFVSETRIDSTSVSEIGFTNAKLTIDLSGDRWFIDDCGFEIYGYANWDSLTYSWYWDEGFEYGKYHRIHFEMDGLLPGMTYNWRPYIQKDTITVYGEFLIFTTKY